MKTLVCDGCQARLDLTFESNKNLEVHALRRVAHARAWVTANGEDFCPTCAQLRWPEEFGVRVGNPKGK